jgi:hypothetical protein
MEISKNESQNQSQNESQNTQRKILEVTQEARLKAIKQSQSNAEAEKIRNVFNMIHNLIVSQFEETRSQKTQYYKP